MSKQNVVFGLAALWELSCIYFSFLAGTSSLTEMFMGPGNLSWPALIQFPRIDEFVALWPSPHAGRAEDGGQLLKVTLYSHMQAGRWELQPSP